jgi:hypothetical protein
MFVNQRLSSEEDEGEEEGEAHKSHRHTLTRITEEDSRQINSSKTQKVLSIINKFDEEQGYQ